MWHRAGEIVRVAGPEHAALRANRQLDAARVALAQGAADRTPIVFEHEIEDMFYGARQFSIRDLNGYELYFIQSTA